MLHQHHLLVGNFHFPLIKEANRLFATPMLPTIIIPIPRKKVNPFRGAFLLRFSPEITPLSGGSARWDPRWRRHAGGLPRWRAGFRSVPSSFPQSDLSHAGKKRNARRIFVYPLARAYPRHAINTSRRQAASAFPALRAPAASEPFPQGSPRVLYQYQLINYCRYCRIFDTAFRYF